MNLFRPLLSLAIFAAAPLTLPADDISVLLKPSSQGTGSQVVSFGFPLPRNLFTDVSKIAVLDSHGVEIPAYVEQLASWHGRFAGPRSALLQFTRNFSSATNYQRVTVRTGVVRTQSLAAKTPIAGTLRDSAGLQLPKVWAALPSDWMCRSWVAGPQVTKQENTGSFSVYEIYGMQNFLTARNYNLCPDGQACADPWLYDRATVMYKLYIRAGHENNLTGIGFQYLQEAYRSADLYRTYIDSRGCFIPKNSSEDCDGKYSYTECMALHYLMTGDDRFLEVIRRVKTSREKALYGSTGLPYTPGSFWTERDHANAWSAFVHSFNATGDQQDSITASRFLNTLLDMQDNPYPRDQPADGCWRHNSTDHLEGGNTWGCSPWMSSWLVDVMFQWYLVTGDSRIINAFQKWGEFLYRWGNRITSDGKPTLWYYATSLGGKEGDPSFGDDGDVVHNMEAAFQFSLGYWAYGRTNPAGINYPAKISLHYTDIITRSASVPPRMFNWVFRSSSWMLYFMDPARPLPGDILSVENQRADLVPAAEAGLEASPNPFNSNTTIRFRLAAGRQHRMNLSIYDCRGGLAAKLANGAAAPGSYSIPWNTAGQASGIYVAQLIVDGKKNAKQIFLLK